METVAGTYGALLIGGILASGYVYNALSIFDKIIIIFLRDFIYNSCEQVIRDCHGSGNCVF